MPKIYILTREQYDNAMARVSELIDCEIDSAEEQELLELAGAIEEYEKANPVVME